MRKLQAVEPARELSDSAGERRVAFPLFRQYGIGPGGSSDGSIGLGGARGSIGS